MPWDTSNYPDSFKNLAPEVRKKAIEIANALREDNYEEGRAISIATTKAREYVLGANNGRPHYVVKPRDDEWIFMKKNGEKAIFKEKTKDDLLQKSKPYVNEKDGVLSIYLKDGTHEETLYED